MQNQGLRRCAIAFVVTENCHKCRFTECVAVCPVDCFYGDAEMLYIDPDECIDCGACVPACPVEAIYDQEDVPDHLASWIQIAVDKVATGTLEHVTEPQDPLPGAEERKKDLGF